MCEQLEFDPSRLQEYLIFLKACQDEKSGTGGLIMAIKPNGSLIFGELSDMSQLRLLHREFIIEEFVSKEINSEKLIQSEQELERNEEQGFIRKIKPRGPSL